MSDSRYKLQNHLWIENCAGRNIVHIVMSADSKLTCLVHRIPHYWIYCYDNVVFGNRLTYFWHIQVKHAQFTRLFLLYVLTTAILFHNYNWHSGEMAQYIEHYKSNDKLVFYSHFIKCLLKQPPKYDPPPQFLSGIYPAYVRKSCFKLSVNCKRTDFTTWFQQCKQKMEWSANDMCIESLTKPSSKCQYCQHQSPNFRSELLTCV